MSEPISTVKSRAEDFFDEWRTKAHEKLGIPVSTDDELVVLGGPIFLEFAEAFARKTVMSLAEEAEREPEKIWKSLPQCIGYPKCDGDLIATPHSEECPMHGKDVILPSERVAAWLRSKGVEQK